MNTRKAIFVKQKIKIDKVNQRDFKKLKKDKIKIFNIDNSKKVLF